MTVHLLLPRFGTRDRTGISGIPTAAALTEFDLLSSNRALNFGLGRTLDSALELGVLPSEIGLDLLILAALVYAADTRVSRASESQDSWTREMTLVVPVSDPTRWQSVQPLLIRMLGFLTGDRWELTFRARPSGFGALVSRRGLRRNSVPRAAVANLFSGGLDSLIGAIDALETGTVPLFVSHCAEGATSKAQEACFADLRGHYQGVAVDRLRAWISFPKNLISGSQSEDTTRGRSFLFFALAAFAGTGLPGRFSIVVPENGLISLNVPLDPLRLGSLSTRTTHPFYIGRWNELLEGLGITGVFRNPYQYRTKGEMVAMCANRDLLLKVLPKSISCASPAKGRWQGRAIEHCGHCVPCIIRRAAVAAALGCDPTNYSLDDLNSRILNTKASDGRQIRSFQLAAARLERRPDLAKLLIHKTASLNDDAAHINELADVYLRGMREVATLLKGVTARPS